MIERGGVRQQGVKTPRSLALCAPRAVARPPVSSAFRWARPWRRAGRVVARAVLLVLVVGGARAQSLPDNGASPVMAGGGLFGVLVCVPVYPLDANPAADCRGQPDAVAVPFGWFGASALVAVFGPYDAPPAAGGSYSYTGQYAYVPISSVAVDYPSPPYYVLDWSGFQSPLAYMTTAEFAQTFASSQGAAVVAVAGQRGALSSLSVSDGASIAAAIGGLWALAWVFSMIRRMISQA